MAAPAGLGGGAGAGGFLSGGSAGAGGDPADFPAGGEKLCGGHSAAEPQPNRRGGCRLAGNSLRLQHKKSSRAEKNLRASSTGHACGEAGPDWDRLAGVDTLIILMGVANRARIAAELIAAGRDPQQPVAFVENGTLARERVVVTDLGAVAAGRVEVESPAVMVVGEVVRLRGQFMAAVQRATA